MTPLLAPLIKFVVCCTSLRCNCLQKAVRLISMNLIILLLTTCFARLTRHLKAPGKIRLESSLVICDALFSISTESCLPKKFSKSEHPIYQMIVSTLIYRPLRSVNEVDGFLFTSFYRVQEYIHPINLFTFQGKRTSNLYVL